MTQTKTFYVRDAPRPLKAIRPHPCASLFLLISLTAGVFAPLHDFRGNPFLGQEQAVTERSPRKNVVVSCILQHSFTLGASRAQSENSDAQPFASALPSMAKSTFQNWTKRALLSAKISHALSQRIGIFPAQPPSLRHITSHHRSRHQQVVWGEHISVNLYHALSSM